jgi:hypothetical protein
MRYRKYHRRKSTGEEALEILTWLVDWKWQIGATLAAISYGAFFVALNSAFHTLAELEKNPIAAMLPKALYCWPPLLFLGLAIIFTWLAIRSWIKANETPSRWY